VLVGPRQSHVTSGFSRTVKMAAAKFSERLFEGLDIQARIVRARARQHEDSVASFSTAVAHHV
jgi:hypothetical protein